MKNKIRRPVFAIALLVFLLAAMAVLVYFVSTLSSMVKIELRNEAKLESSVNTINRLFEAISADYDEEQNRTLNNVKMMCAALRQYVTEEGYDGPEIFEDGLVLRIKGSSIVYPEGFSGTFEGLELQEPDGQILRAVMRKDGGPDPVNYVLAAAQVVENLWYVDYTIEEEFYDETNQQARAAGLLQDTEKSYGGYILVVDADDPEMNLLYRSEDFGPEPVTISDLGIAKDKVLNRDHFLELNRTIYNAKYVNTGIFGRDVLVILLLDSKYDMHYSLLSVVLAVLIVLIIMLSVIFWLYLVQRFVQEHPLTPEQKKAYHPRQLRRTAAAAGLISVILYFVLALTSQTIINLYREAGASHESLHIIRNRLENGEKHSSINRQNEEAWAVYSAERIAGLLKTDPRLRSHAFLEEVSRIIGADCIMLFDENGNEVLSSNSFVGFSLGTGADDDTTDFLRLLKGVDTIVHEPAVEKTTGRFVQLVGTAFPLDEEKYGALILAVNPKRTWQLSDKDDFSDFIQMVTPEGNLCLIESLRDGKIKYASDASFAGKTTQDTGLSAGAEDSFVFDSFTVNGQQYYGTYEKNDEYCLFYLTGNKYIQLNTVPFALSVTFCFCVIYLVITVFMLRPYRSDVYEKTAALAAGKHSEMPAAEGESGGKNAESGMNDLNSSVKRHLDVLPPEKKVIRVLQIFLSVVFLILMIRWMLNPLSVISFILFGNWKHGFNLLSFSGSVLLVLFFAVLVLFKNTLTDVMEDVLNPKALTIWKLTASLIQYFSFLLMLYGIFIYLGFNANVLLAFFSAFSLAVSLGAKDLVADILAGVFLVFEDDFRVGDIIDAGGFKGRVLEIGPRSTKLISEGENIKVIGNQSMKNILNLSRRNSWYIMQVKVPANRPLEEVEAMLERELPEIGVSIPEVISGPFYKDVQAIDGGVNTLSIVTECREEDFRCVRGKVNHGIRLLFDKNGIPIK